MKPNQGSKGKLKPERIGKEEIRLYSRTELIFPYQVYMDIPILKPFKLRTRQMRKEQEFHRLLPYTLDFVLAGPQTQSNNQRCEWRTAKKKHMEWRQRNAERRIESPYLWLCPCQAQSMNFSKLLFRETSSRSITGLKIEVAIVRRPHYIHSDDTSE